jgi:hypothetical protein
MGEITRSPDLQETPRTELLLVIHDQVQLREVSRMLTPNPLFVVKAEILQSQIPALHQGATKELLHVATKDLRHAEMKVTPRKPIRDIRPVVTREPRHVVTTDTLLAAMTDILREITMGILLAAMMDIPHAVRTDIHRAIMMEILPEVTTGLLHAETIPAVMTTTHHAAMNRAVMTTIPRAERRRAALAGTIATEKVIRANHHVNQNLHHVINRLHLHEVIQI